MKKNILQIEEKIEELKHLLRIEKFIFSEIEIKNISISFINNHLEDELIYYYIGQAFINLIGGKWKLNTTKKDPAYGRMCIVDWTKGSTRIDPKPILEELKQTKNYNTIYNTIESTKKNIDEINSILKDIGLDS